MTQKKDIKKSVCIRSIKLWMLLLSILLSNSFVKAQQDVACYIHKRATYRYVSGFGDLNGIHNVDESYSWQRKNKNDKLIYTFNGVICSPTLSITVNTSGSDSDSEGCSVNEGQTKKGGEGYSLSADFYTFPTFTTSMGSENHVCISEEQEDDPDYTFTVSKSHAFFTDNLVSKVYLQIANNTSFSGANTFEIPESGSVTKSYADLAGTYKNPWYGKPLYFRLRYRMFNGQYLSGRTSEQFTFYPVLTFDEDVIIDLPDCAGIPTIKIPVSKDEINYIITVKVKGDNGHGYNFSTSKLEKTDDDRYFILDNNSPCLNGDPVFIPDKYELGIEQADYDGENGTPCRYGLIFTIDPYLEFSATFDNRYVDEVDANNGLFQILKPGGQGGVEFNVFNSKSENVRVYNGADYIGEFPIIISTRETLSGVEYISGKVIAYFKEGTYNDVTIQSSGCTADITKAITLKEPAAITFTATPNTISCHSPCLEGTTNDGKITITSIQGGIGKYYLTVKEHGGAKILDKGDELFLGGLTYFENGYDVIISDGHGNSTTVENVEVKQPEKIEFQVIDKTRPSISCGYDGTATAGNATGGVKPYLYSYNMDPLKFSNDTKVTGYNSGDHFMYLKDGKGCIAKQSVEIPTTPEISIASEVKTKPSCIGENDGSYTATVSNRKGTISIDIDKDYTSITPTCEGNVINIEGLPADTYTLTIQDDDGTYQCKSKEPITFEIEEKDPMTLAYDENKATNRVTNKGTATGSATVYLSNEISGKKTFKLYESENSTSDTTITHEADTAFFNKLSGSPTGKIYYVDVEYTTNGCKYSDENNDKYYQIKIYEPAKKLNLRAREHQPISCYNGDNGIVELTASDGWIEEYEYADSKKDWQDSNIFRGRSPGEHTFYVKDKYGGMDSVKINLNDPPELKVEYVATQDVLCKNFNTGWLQYNVRGGTEPYSFKDILAENQTRVANGGEGTLLTAINLPAKEDYIFTIKDNNGCQVTTAKEKVDQPDSELSISYDIIQQPNCEKENGEFEAQAAGGTAPYDYYWNDIDNNTLYEELDLNLEENFEVKNIPTAIYNLVVEDKNGCKAYRSDLTFERYTNPIIDDVLVTDVTCFDAKNGVIDVIASSEESSISSYIYKGEIADNEGSSASNIFTGLLPDTYELYVYDELGCRSNSPEKVTITQPDTSIYAIIDTIRPVILNGENSGMIGFRVFGGNGYTLNVSLLNEADVEIAQQEVIKEFKVYFKNLYAGTYKIKVEDDKFCDFELSGLEVIEKEKLGFNVIEKQDAMCKAQTGSFTIEGYGGWGNYEFKQASKVYTGDNSFNNLYAGNYIVSVKDKLGGIFTDTVVIYEPKDSLQAILLDSSNPTCDENGSLSINLSGGVAPYKLFFENSNDTTDIASPQEYIINNRPAGGYMLQIRDNNGCKFEMETFLSDQELIEIVDFDLTYPSSNIDSDGVIEVHVKGGKSPLSYSWKELFGNSLGETTSVLSNVASGHYEVTVSEQDGCSKSKRVYLPNITDLPLEIIELNHERSYQAENGSAQLYTDLESLFTVQVIDPKGISTIYNIDESTADFDEINGNIYLSNLMGGGYFVMVTNAEGEKAYVEFDIEAYAEFYIADVQITHVKELNDSSGVIDVTVAGGAGDNIFEWLYLDGAGTNIQTINSEYNSILKNAIAGNYRVSVTDKYNNESSQTILVEQPDAALEISISDFRNETCKDSVNAYVKLQATGGWGDYQFRQDSVKYYSNSDTWTNLEVREHYFYLTDKMGVVDSVSINITEPDYLRTNVEFIDSVDCKNYSDGNILFDISGGTEPYRYAFLESPDVWTQDTIARDLPSGNYSFIFTDNGSNNCIGIDTIHTYMPEPDTVLYIVVDTIAPVLHKGTNSGKIYFTVYGGNDGLKRISLLDVDDTVIDQITGTNEFQLYFDSLPAGSYNLYVTDVRGCYYETGLQTVKEPQTALGFDIIQKTDALCKAQTGSFTIEAYGGWGDYTYKRAADKGFYNINTFKNLYSGNYAVSVKDKYGAIFTDTVIIYEPKDSLMAEIIDYTDPTCDDNGSISLSLKGGVAPYKMFFENESDTIRIASPQSYYYHNRPAGGNLLHIVDDNGCKFELEANLSDKDLLDIVKFKLTYPSIDGASDGAIEAFTNGGMPPLNFSWKELFGETLAETSSILSDIPSDHYKLTVSEDGGCSQSENVYLPEISDQAMEVIVLQHETSYLAQNGYSQIYAELDSITDVEVIDPQGVRVFYTVHDSTADFYEEEANLYLRNLSGGSYFVMGTNIHGEKAFVEFDIEPYAEFYFEDIQVNHAKEMNDSSGWISVVVAGGANGKSFEWEFLDGALNMPDTASSNNTSTIRNTVAGNYRITITDKYNNSITENILIKQPDAPLKISISEYRNESCKDYEDAYVYLNAEGGWGDYQFRSDLVDYYTNDTAWLNLVVREYTFYLTDKYGAVDSIVLDITEPEYLRTSIDSIQIVKCKDGSDGNIFFNITGGTEPYSYALQDSPTEWTQDTTARDLYEGAYSFIFTDKNNCYGQDTINTYMAEPDTVLYTIIDTIVPVLHKGTNTGRVYCTLYGGNDGLKTISLLNSENIIIDQKFERNNFTVYFDSLYTGNYSIHVEDFKGCAFTTEVFTVDEPQTALSFNIIDKSDALCKAQTGRFTVEGIGGWGDYSYKREFDNGYYTINAYENLYSGNYIISVKDKYGAIFTDTVVVYEPKDSLQATIIDYSDPSCGSNGSFSINLNGGIAPYSMFFDKSSDTTELAIAQDYTFNNLEAGGYLLHIEDHNGCKFDLETSLSDEELLEIKGFDLTYPSADTASDGIIEALIDGGKSTLNFTWREINGGTLEDTSSVLSDVPSGQYEVSVREADGCSQSRSVYLPNISDKALEIIDLQHETSYLAQNGYVHLFSHLDSLENIKISGTNGMDVGFNISDSTIGFYANDLDLYLSNLPCDHYFVEATNHKGEKAYVEFDIDPYQLFYFEDIIISHAREINDPSGIISVAVAGGAGGNIFEWEHIDRSAKSLDTVNDINTGVLQNALAGNYKLTVRDRYNNSISKGFTIKQPDAPLEVTISEYRNESCKDYEDAYVILEATGGWGDYQYRQDVIDNYSNSRSWPNLDVREHYFYLTDKMGVVDSIAIDITEPGYLKADVRFIDSVDCKNANDGLIYFDVTGGTKPYRFAMQESNALWTQDTIVRNLEVGNYSFMFTDKNNCIGQDTVETYMPEPDSLLFNSIEVIHTTCNTDNGEITVAMQGGTRPYQYEWTDFEGNIVGDQNVISGLERNNTYFLNVLDAHNCPQKYKQFIKPSTNPIIVDIDVTPVLCNKEATGTASIAEVTPAEPFAPYSFSWSNSDIGEFSDGYPAGTHSVVITDTNNCSTLKYFEITEPDTLALTLMDIKDAHCYGYNDAFIAIEASGGVGNYQYKWSNGESTARIDLLYKGVYTVTITDANLCAIDDIFEITEPDLLTFDLGDDVRICPGNSITIDGQDFSSHEWSDANGVISNERFLTIDEEATYYLEVTNEIGCYAHDEISLSIGNDALKADFLMSSEAFLGDTLFIYEVSNTELDSLYWNYSTEAFSDISHNSLPSYMLHLKSNLVGVYNIGLWGYSGGCISKAIKQVEIIEGTDTLENNFLGYEDPLITELTIYPNPTDGNFSVGVELREESDILVSLFNINLGTVIDLREEYGMKHYSIDYQLQELNTGVYLIMVTAKKERKQLKLIVQ